MKMSLSRVIQQLKLGGFYFLHKTHMPESCAGDWFKNNELSSQIN